MTFRSIAVSLLTSCFVFASISRLSGEPVAPLKLVLVGDSTVCDYPAQRPDRGWGQYFGEHFQPGSVSVINHAASGRSTKTFINEGRWTPTTAPNRVAKRRLLAARLCLRLPERRHHRQHWLCRHHAQVRHLSGIQLPQPHLGIQHQPSHHGGQRRCLPSREPRSRRRPNHRHPGHGSRPTIPPNHRLFLRSHRTPPCPKPRTHHPPRLAVADADERVKSGSPHESRHPRCRWTVDQLVAHLRGPSPEAG
jgi:hypothetical protein